MVLLLALLRFRHKNHLVRLKDCGFVLIDVLVATKTSGNDTAGVLTDIHW